MSESGSTLLAKDGVYPAGLEAEETILHRQRREAWSSETAFIEAKPLCGLAISGGGLRSATFALGVLQALASRRLFRHIDYLSTVSGGSYIGGFLGALFHRAKTATEAEETLADRRSPVVNWLRENGRYLAPGGGSDGWAALSVVLRNVVAVNIVLWMMVLTLFLGLDLLRGYIFPHVTGLVDPSDLDRLSTGAIWWSPSLVIPLAIFALCLFPLGLAYWRVPSNEESRRRSAIVSLVSNVVLFGVSAWLYVRVRPSPHMDTQTLFLLFAIFGTTFLSWLWYWAPSTTADMTQGTKDAIRRARLTRWLRSWLIVFAVLLVASLLDSLGQTLYRVVVAPCLVREHLIGTIVGGVTALFAAGAGIQKAVDVLGVKKGIGGIPLQVLAFVGALVVVVPVLTGLSAVGHGMAWGWQDPSVPSTGPSCPQAVGAKGVEPSPPSPEDDTVAREPPLSPFAPLLCLVGAVLCWLYGRTFSFLNGSSLASLYAARLTRAYVGASNPERLKAEVPSTELLPGDCIAMSEYAPHLKGGALHIINMTLNETLGGRSQVQERDRKGMNLAFGPSGVSVAVRHHATWNRDGGRLASLTSADALDGEFHVFPRVAAGKPLVFVPELLDLGRWIAISGAAASTALGSLTSPWLSLLCGIFNVRLGHWWASGVDPRTRTKRAKLGGLRWMGAAASRLFPVQVHLLHEVTARFPGTASRRWYLTDGGHFENTGAYELIRRRLPWIIILDDGADPGTTFEDVANLVRKARVDFDAEISFCDTTEAATEVGKAMAAAPLGLDLSHVGTLEDLVTKKYAALATIKYAGDVAPTGRLLLVKPRVLGNEPLDVTQYKKANPTFPQQTTADQFFDEAQWESYRRLGDHIGTILFGGAPERPSASAPEVAS